MGQGIMPRAYHPIVAKLSDEELARLFDTLRSQVDRTVAGLPNHADYVARYCAAVRPQAA